MTALNKIEVHVTDREAIDARLESATKDLQQKAMQDRDHGILVIRHKPGHFTVDLSAAVPFGTTMERSY